MDGVKASDLVYEKDGKMEVLPGFTIGLRDDRGNTVAVVQYKAIKAEVMDQNGNWVERRFPVEE
jgi:hypothetical protein